ncbi:hypothetical protein K438DRAFT_1751101 [Mycena galopus ATCC 62051]|nr:hypothetical protein K438DRAFT_1751101 [Mycena galopus ATCC 62051]
MSGSSAMPPTGSNPFMKRRRAYVACANCRKRKVKCVTPSEVDYKPCTRCSQKDRGLKSLKGLKCEYFPDDAPSEPNTPPAGAQPPVRYSEPGWAPPPITPPSAGINEYLNSGSSSSRSGRRGTVPSTTTSARYPYRPVTPASRPPATAGAAWNQQPTQQYSAQAYPSQGSGAMQQHPGAMTPQYYPGTTPYPGGGGNGGGHGGGSSSALYNPNYSQQYAQYAPQPSGTVSAWSPAA